MQRIATRGIFLSYHPPMMGYFVRAVQIPILTTLHFVYRVMDGQDTSYRFFDTPLRLHSFIRI